MVEMLEKPEVGALTLAPKNPLPYRQQLKAVRSFIDGYSGAAWTPGARSPGSCSDRSGCYRTWC